MVSIWQDVIAEENILWGNNLYIFDQLQPPPPATGISELSCILNNFKNSILKCKALSASAIKWQPDLLHKSVKGSPIVSLLSLPSFTCTSKQETSRDCKRQGEQGQRHSLSAEPDLIQSTGHVPAGSWGMCLRGEVVPACKPTTSPREMGLDFPMGNNRMHRDEEREGICSLCLQEWPCKGLGEEKALQTGCPALPGQGEGFMPLSPAQFRQRRALAAAHSLHGFNLSQHESTCWTTWESQCQRSFRLWVSWSMSACHHSGLVPLTPSFAIKHSYTAVKRSMK